MIWTSNLKSQTYTTIKKIQINYRETCKKSKTTNKNNKKDGLTKANQHPN